MSDDLVVTRVYLEALSLGELVEHVTTVADARAAMRSEPRRAVLFVSDRVSDGDPRTLLALPGPPRDPVVTLCASTPTLEASIEAECAGLRYLPLTLTEAQAPDPRIVLLMQRHIRDGLDRQRTTDDRVLDVAGDLARRAGLEGRKLLVLEALALGEDVAGIADEVGISERIARKELEAIYDAVALVVRVRGLVATRDWIRDHAFRDALRPSY